MFWNSECLNFIQFYASTTRHQPWTRRNFSSITEWSGVGGVAGWGNYEIKKNRRYVLRPGLKSLYDRWGKNGSNYCRLIISIVLGSFWAGKHRTYIYRTQCHLVISLYRVNYSLASIKTNKGESFNGRNWKYTSHCSSKRVSSSITC